MALIWERQYYRAGDGRVTFQEQVLLLVPVLQDEEQVIGEFAGCNWTVLCGEDSWERGEEGGPVVPDDPLPDWGVREDGAVCIKAVLLDDTFELDPVGERLCDCGTAYAVGEDAPYAEYYPIDDKCPECRCRMASIQRRLYFEDTGFYLRIQK